jgi:hypothetical protein
MIESSDVIGLNFANQNPLLSYYLLTSFYLTISSCPIQKKKVLYYHKY